MEEPYERADLHRMVADAQEHIMALLRDDSAVHQAVWSESKYL